jgi:hypothetical protein
MKSMRLLLGLAQFGEVELGHVRPMGSTERVVVFAVVLGLFACRDRQRQSDKLVPSQRSILEPGERRIERHVYAALPSLPFGL